MSFRFLLQCRILIGNLAIFFFKQTHLMSNMHAKLSNGPSHVSSSLKNMPDSSAAHLINRGPSFSSSSSYGSVLVAELSMTQQLFRRRKKLYETKSWKKTSDDVSGSLVLEKERKRRKSESVEESNSLQGTWFEKTLSCITSLVREHSDVYRSVRNNWLPGLLSWIDDFFLKYALLSLLCLKLHG